MEENLSCSVLGTKSHWDDVYRTEIDVFKECGDEGENWFGEGTMRRVINYVSSLGPDVKSKPILDIGCGNGSVLVELWNKGFTNILGIDYSENAIVLARSVAESHECQARFEVVDFVKNYLPENKFDIVLDKGTYDAICLDPVDVTQKREIYQRNIYQTLSDKGLFVITSCNWTEEELISQFSTKLRHKETLPSAAFTFGGKTGNKTTSVVFEKF